MSTKLKPQYTAKPFAVQQELLPKDKHPSPELVAEFIQNGKVVAWFHHTIHVGTVEEGKFQWFDRQSQVRTDSSDFKIYHLDWQTHLVELRAFNEDREWRTWRQGRTLRSRTLVDSPPNGQALAETVAAQDAADKAVAKGLAHTETVDAKMKLRGIVAKGFQNKGETETLYLTTRNYLSQNEFGLTHYGDCRFVSIEKKENNQKED